MLTEEQKKLLVEAAVSVRNNAYAPYSNYFVGAALLSESGKIFLGCNFENASFGAGSCAERVALGAAIAGGQRKFKGICVCGESSTVTPCGICRQALSEFGDMAVICCDAKGESIKEYKLSELLPAAFDASEL